MNMERPTGRRIRRLKFNGNGWLDKVVAIKMEKEANSESVWKYTVNSTCSLIVSGVEHRK